MEVSSLLNPAPDVLDLQYSPSRAVETSELGKGIGEAAFMRIHGASATSTGPVVSPEGVPLEHLPNSLPDGHACPMLGTSSPRPPLDLVSFLQSASIMDDVRFVNGQYRSKYPPPDDDVYFSYTLRPAIWDDLPVDEPEICSTTDGRKGRALRSRKGLLYPTRLNGKQRGRELRGHVKVEKKRSYPRKEAQMSKEYGRAVTRSNMIA